MNSVVTALEGLFAPANVGGLAVLLAGLLLTLKGQSEVGNTLLVAGAAELGVKLGTAAAAKS